MYLFCSRSRSNSKITFSTPFSQFLAENLSRRTSWNVIHLLFRRLFPLIHICVYHCLTFDSTSESYTNIIHLKPFIFGKTHLPFTPLIDFLFVFSYFYTKLEQFTIFCVVSRLEDIRTHFLCLCVTHSFTLSQLASSCSLYT